jgi:hypothetical protein
MISLLIISNISARELDFDGKDFKFSNKRLIEKTELTPICENSSINHVNDLIEDTFSIK